MNKKQMEERLKEMIIIDDYALLKEEIALKERLKEIKEETDAIREEIKELLSNVVTNKKSFDHKVGDLIFTYTKVKSSYKWKNEAKTIQEKHPELVEKIIVWKVAAAKVRELYPHLVEEKQSTPRLKVIDTHLEEKVATLEKSEIFKLD